MKGELALEQIAALTIVMLMTGIGLQIISELRTSASKQEINMKEFYPEIDYSYCSQYETNQKIDRKEFFEITYYRLQNSCKLETQQLTADFTLEKEMIESETRKWNLQDSSGDPLLFYRQNCNSAKNLGLKGVTFGKEESILYHPGDKINITGTGDTVIIC